ncbi:hypothetical protein [uncultured Oceanicoccus sp.]|uniref:hypothetical protein n=1 Tax=uncultured Oceanicoccus sp. TaxID=1706381 RepID=UPI0030D6D70E
MSTGSWDPKLQQTPSEKTINTDDLLRFIELSESGQLDELASLISQDEQQQQAGLMTLDKEQWFEASQVLSDHQLQHLMRFFTIAERLPGWEAQGKSPVIWLGKVLKQRGIGINRDLVLWIKTNSDNQYLPHGPLL